MIFNLTPSWPHVDEITQGDTINWVFLLPDYPNDSWTAQLAFMQAGSKVGTPQTMTADPDNVNNWMVTVDAATSAKLPPGDCEVYTIMLSTDTQPVRVSVYQGDVTIMPNPTGTLPQSPNMMMLAAVNKSISTILGQPEQSASFNGQTYTLHNVKDLFAIRNELQFKVNAEMAALGVSHGKNYKTLQDRFI